MTDIHMYAYKLYIALDICIYTCIYIHKIRIKPNVQNKSI